MKKIVVLSNHIETISKFRYELLKELIQKNNEIILISPKNLDNSFHYNKITKLNLKFIEIDISQKGKNVFKELNIVLNYLKILKKINPDVVLTYTIKPNLYGGIVCRLLKIPYIVTITGLGTVFQKDSILKKIIIFSNKIALKDAKKIFFQNKENMNIFLKNKIIKEKQIKLVNGSGVNLERFNNEIVLKKGTLKILFIGRIMKEKGIEEYLEVVKKVKNRYQNIEFQILGQFEEEKYREVIKNLEKYGMIKYLGISNNVRNELKDIHCLINPSWHEGMSNVLLEAGAMKKFLIASDISGCREIVINNVTGFTFKKQDVDDLENKVQKFINLSEKEYENYINKSYERIRNNFDRNKIVEKYLKVINS